MSAGQRVVWSPDMPAEIRKAASPLVRRWKRLLPGWCSRLEVYYRQEIEAVGGTPLAACIADYDHRTAAIYLRGAWLEEPPDRREWVVVHELCHVLTAPMADWCDRLLEEPVRDQFRKQWESQVEQAVSDLADCMIRVGAHCTRGG